MNKYIKSFLGTVSYISSIPLLLILACEAPEPEEISIKIEGVNSYYQMSGLMHSCIVYGYAEIDGESNVPIYVRFREDDENKFREDVWPVLFGAVEYDSLTVKNAKRSGIDHPLIEEMFTNQADFRPEFGFIAASNEASNYNFSKEE